MALIGYARVSSTDQDLTIQIDALNQAGCDRIFKEKLSGRKVFLERPALFECLDFMREGDVLVFTRLDRVGRSLLDLVNVIKTLGEKGCEVRCLQQPVDTTTAEGRLMVGILGAVAEFEVDIKRERQREGIEQAKKNGKYRGSKPKITRTRVAELKEKGLGAAAIARSLRCDRKTVYRAHPDGWGPRLQMGASA